MDIKSRLQEFSKPGMEYRGAPFWSWNARLKPEELRRQIRVMRDMGMGGFFMHSRVGLDTEYLSEEWFECIRACIDEARNNGMAAWLYDEDRWPSGAAGGIVSSEDKHRMKFLSCEIVPPGVEETPERFTLAYYAGKVDGKKLLSYRRLADGEAPGKGESLLRVFWGYNKKISWFNGESYIDTMSSETIQRFIEVTHERYRREVGEDFGGVIPGIFTDEPAYCYGSVPDRLPWSTAFAVEFRKRQGYDLFEFAPELFFHLEDEFARVRRDFHDTATSLMAENFGGMIGKWCEKNNLQFTGHLMHEDLLDFQTVYCGNPMRFYEHMQTPGIDLLTEHWNIFNTAKQCSSVARQQGRKRRLTETYGCTGWDFPIFGHKALGDWQFALGINLRCHHLFWYSMAAQAKRDYPASISEYSPWYRNYAVVEDYFARIGSLTATDTEVRDLLVVHPIETAWSLMVRDFTVAGTGGAADKTLPGRKAMARFGTDKLFAFDAAYQTLSNKLLGGHIDFDFGEEEMMAKQLKVVSGTELRFGKAAYRAVLIPEVMTIRKSTLDILTDFAERGGKVFFTGKVPKRVNGDISDLAAKVYRKNFTRLTSSTMIPELTAAAGRVSIAVPGRGEASPVLYRLGESSDAYTLFLCNTGMKFTSEIREVRCVRERQLTFPQLEITLKMPEKGKVYEVSLTDGTIRRVRSRYAKGAYRFNTSMGTLASRMFIVTAEDLAAAAPEKASAAKRKAAVLPSANWQYTLDEPNVLVLDHCGWAVNGEAMRKPQFFITIDKELRSMLNVPLRGDQMVQNWVSRIYGERDERTIDLELEYTFGCDKIPESPCRLVVEHPEYYSFELNGRNFEARAAGCWFSSDLTAIEVPRELLKKGRNTLRLRCKYASWMPGLESLFILGDFGVVKGDTLTAAPAVVDCCDLGGQGFTYYSGNITMTNTFDGGKLAGKKVQLAIREDGWRGTMLGISVNGSEEKILPWQPWQLDISRLITAGENTVSITVYGSRRNSFGPFYCEEATPPWVGAYQIESYLTGGRKQLVPFGLLSAPVLEVVSGKGK